MYIKLTSYELKKAIAEYLERSFKISNKSVSFNYAIIDNHKISIDDIEGISDIEIDMSKIENVIDNDAVLLAYGLAYKNKKI